MVPFTFIIVLAVDWERPTIQELHILMIHQYSVTVTSVLLWFIGCGIAPQEQCTVCVQKSSLTTGKPIFKYLKENITLQFITRASQVYTISDHIKSFNFFLFDWLIVKKAGVMCRESIYKYQNQYSYLFISFSRF